MYDERNFCARRNNNSFSQINRANKKFRELNFDLSNNVAIVNINFLFFNIYNNAFWFDKLLLISMFVLRLSIR